MLNRALLLFACFALLLAACGGSSNNKKKYDTTDPGTQPDVTTDASADGTATDAAKDTGTQPDAATDPGTQPDVTTDAGGPASEKLTFTSFNAGLVLNFVPLATERRAPIITALKSLPADVVCLDEVWTDDDAAAVIAGVKQTFPFSFRLRTVDDTVGPPACTAAEATPLRECAVANCATSTNLGTCVVGNCTAEFQATSSGCQNCLAANIAKGDIDVIFKACAEGTASFSQEGRNGLILLSRRTLSSTDSSVFESFLTKRAVITGTVSTVAGDLHVFCTHLTSALSQVTYAGMFDSWEAEQADQIDRLMKFVTSKAGTDAPAVILGDFNDGPAIPPSISAVIPENYKLMTDGGWRDPYAEQTNPPCTWCAANTLVDDTSGDELLDHIFMANLDGPASAASVRRLLDETVMVDVNGTATETNLSDHFGIEVSFTIAP